VPVDRIVLLINQDKIFTTKTGQFIRTQTDCARKYAWLICRGKRLENEQMIGMGVGGGGGGQR
jgi:hypothetical protein